MRVTVVHEVVLVEDLLDKLDVSLLTGDHERCLALLIFGINVCTEVEQLVNALNRFINARCGAPLHNGMQGFVELTRRKLLVAFFKELLERVLISFA